MTVVGIQTIVDGFTSYARGLLSSDDGLWLILMDGPLLIPLGFAAFFYPVWCQKAAEIRESSRQGRSWPLFPRSLRECPTRCTSS